MNVRSPLLRTIALLAVAAAVAAGCGGDDNGQDASEVDGPGTDAAREVSTEVDRSGRFSGVDEFCRAAEEEPEEEPESTGPGITAETISVSHVRVKLEDLADIGFGVEIGDMADQAQTFVDVINEECGGIHGRRIELSLTEIAVPGLGGGNAEVEAQEACIEIAEDREAVFAFALAAVSGALPGCLTGQQEVILVSSATGSDSDYERAEGRWFSTFMDPTDLLRYTARELANELEGKRIGVVYQDSDTNPQIVQEGLVSELEALGLDVVRVDALGCNNTATCGGNVIPSAQGMVADRVDVLFPLLNVVSLPGYVAELATQGMKSDQVQIYNTAYHAQDGDIVSGKVVEFGGEPAGRLYDGSIIIANTPTGDYRTPGYEPNEFAAMCNRTYAEHSKAGEGPYDPRDGVESSMYGAVSTHCHLVRMVARAIDSAGPNPSRAELAEAMGRLGGVDLSSGAGASFRPGKTTAPDEIIRLRFRFPCPEGPTTASGACIVPDSEFLPLPEE